VKISIGGAAIFLGQLRWMVNLLVSDVPGRYPHLKFVSVESGVGWIPFFLKTLDYQVGEMTPGSTDNLSMAPSDYFRRQIHSCFWFERAGIVDAIDSIGADHLMFETDFPHPTCVYPDELEFAGAALEGVDDDTLTGIMGLNAARLYRIPLPA
jgi:predicted TIM-barrel fold metal-dependent hydrolase